MVQKTNQSGVVHRYRSYGWFAALDAFFGFTEARDGSFDIQPGGEVACPFFGDRSGRVMFEADEWMTFQVGIPIGEWADE